MRSKVGPPLGIQTLAQLQQANRRLDHLRRDTNRALSANAARRRFVAPVL